MKSFTTIRRLRSLRWKRRQIDCGQIGTRRAFTLVEMLVVVAIVLLLMSMFTQIFVSATDSLSKQRGIAENDQRGRMLSSTFRSDLNNRTFRDVLPFLSNEDTRQLGHSLARRAGYIEICEGLPNDPTDDYIQFTASVNIQLQGRVNSPFVGQASPSFGGVGNPPISAIAIAGITSTSTIVMNGDMRPYIAMGSNLWITGGYQNNGRYIVVAPAPLFASGQTTITLATPTSATPLNTAPKALGSIVSETDPDFDDGVFGNGSASSALAEICYFLRNGVLYRRVLLIRDTLTGGSAQPTWSTGMPVLWSGTNENYGTSGSTTFWRDYDFSAYYYPGKTTGLSPNPQAPGVRFHDSRESMSNSSQAELTITNEALTPIQLFPQSLGIPHLRFGHSTSNGLAQDSSTTAFIGGTAVTLNRFTLQECSNTAFGYPGYLPPDPITAAPNTNPFDRQNIQINPATGMVAEYSTQLNRRGEDILMSNVLTFDIKVWDANINQFVDLGDDTVAPSFPAGAPTAPTFGSGSPCRVNTTYGPNGHFRFDTWHPLAATPSSATPPNSDFQPPYVPVNAATGLVVPLSAIQITINYRDVSSNQIRQLTIVQSLVDRVKPASVTNEAPEE